MPAGKVYGFRVLLKNVGNGAIEDQIVAFELDDAARVVKVELEEAPFAFGGTTDSAFMGSRSIPVCQIPYLREKEEVIVSIQSVLNESPSCNVHARSPHVTVVDLDASVARVAAALASLMMLGMAMSLAGVIWGLLRYGDARISDVASDGLVGPIILAMQVGFIGAAVITNVLFGLVIVVTGRGLRAFPPLRFRSLGTHDR